MPDFFKQHASIWFPVPAMMCSVFIVIILETYGFSLISYNLYRSEIVQYRTDFQINYQSLTYDYFWHLIDMIPSIEFWSTLGISDPLKGDNIWARLPVLLFKLSVIIPAFSVIKFFWDIIKSMKI